MGKPKVLEVVDKAVLKSYKEAITLLASSWSDNIYTYTNSQISSVDTVVEIYPSKDITTEQLEALQAANIIGGTQSVGSLQLVAKGDVPTVDIPLTIIIRGDV